MIFSNIILLFWQISALDLESINVKFLFYKCYILDLLFLVIDDFCYGWGGIPYFVRA